MAKESVNNFPEKVNNFNVYEGDANKLLGIADEVELPKFEPLTEEVSGPGILGTYESASVGQFGPMSLEIPFNVCEDEGALQLLNMNKNIKVTLRGSMQFADGETGGNLYKSIRVVARGRNKLFEPGKLKIGGKMDTKIAIEVTYIFIQVNGKDVIELDKLNNVYKVNGVDLLAEISKQC